jgi:hypothetical protein
MRSRGLERAVVVAVVAVRVMQVAVDQVVDVITVRHRLVPAAGAVLVARLVPFAAMLGRAAAGIAGRHLDHVLVDVVAVRMMQVTVVEIVDVIAMAHRAMPAIGPVLVRVIGVVRLRARGHGWPPWSVGWTTTIMEIGPDDHPSRQWPGLG